MHASTELAKPGLEPLHSRKVSGMQKRPGDLFISTTSFSTPTSTPRYKWSAPRPPTPRLNTFFSSFAIIGATLLQTPPPVPSLSFFEPDSPLSLSSPLTASSSPSTRSQHSFDRPASATSMYTMSPVNLYISPLPLPPQSTPLLSPGWVIPSPEMPLSSPISSPLWSPASNSTPLSSYNSSRADLRSPCSTNPSSISSPMSSLTSVASSLSQTCSRKAKKAKLTLQRSAFHVFEFERAQNEIMSPMLSPRFLWPRTPPAPPTIKAPSTTRTAKRKSQNWYTATPSKATPTNTPTKLTKPQPKPSKSYRGKSQNITPINVQKAWRKSLGKSLDPQTEAVGWGDIESPVRLHFKRKSQLLQDEMKAKETEPTKESIQERRLKGMRSVQSLRSLKSVRSSRSARSPRLPRYQENFMEI